MSIPPNVSPTAFNAALIPLALWMPEELVIRLARAYGTRIERLLAGRGSIADMGREIASGLYAAEAEYLMRHEWARCADDMLWRRSKLGLHLPSNTAAALDAWIAEQRNAIGTQQPIQTSFDGDQT